MPKENVTTTEVAAAPVEVTTHTFVGTDKDLSTSTEPVRPEGGRGQTLLRAFPGYAHDPGFDDLPLVTASGLYVTAEQAQRILDDSAPFGTVYKESE